MYDPEELDMVEKWGTGLFENDADGLIIRDLTKESGVAKSGVTSFLYPTDVPTWRRKLDEGALDHMLNKRLPIDYTTIFEGHDDKDTMWMWPPNRCPGYHLCLLGAIMMRLGCKIRPDFRQSLEELHTKVGFSRNAQVQLRHALNVYVDGTPYDFRYKLRPVGLDQDVLATDSVWGDISECLFEVAESYDPMLKIAIRQALGPMLKCIAAHDNQHPHEACGNCGKKNANDGSPCRPCSQCGQRLYCSRKCELAHRPQHKLICDDPTYRRMGNPWVALQKTRKEKQAALLTDLNDLTLDGDRQNDMPSAKPASPASPNSTVGGDLTTCGHCDTSSPATTPQSVTFVISFPTSPFPTPLTPWTPGEQNPFYDK
ncbi:hypothetical protein KCU90_g16035, partial [Aureobasidium melanogenum]